MQSPSTPTCMLDDFRCRLCFSSSGINLQPLFPPGEDCFVNDLLSQIHDCLAIHVSFLEDFCSVVCSGCRDKINAFYHFKKQCQSNDGYLREKRSRQMNGGVELERISRMNRDQPDDAGANQCKVEEPQEEESLRQTKSVFAPEQAAESKVIVPTKVDVAVQISGTSSSESFRGFPNELFKKIDTEDCEIKDEPTVPIDDIQECHIPLEKLDIKPCVDEVQKTNTKRGLRGKYRKQIKTVPQSPRLLRKKAVLYFDGYEYRKPRTCHDGIIKWGCCKISCPATLQQKSDGTMKLTAKHQQHPEQVVNDGMIVDRKLRKRVPFLVTSNNHKKRFIYNDSFRYHFSQKLNNGQMIWTCDDQPEGCKAYVKIAADFRYATPIFRHNHTAEIVVHRRIAD